jgi:hypothetical protein
LEALRDCFVAAGVQGQLLIDHRVCSNKFVRRQRREGNQVVIWIFLDYFWIFRINFCFHAEPRPRCFRFLMLDLFAYLPPSNVRQHHCLSFTYQWRFMAERGGGRVREIKARGRREALRRPADLHLRASTSGPRLLPD